MTGVKERIQQKPAAYKRKVTHLTENLAIGSDEMEKRCYNTGDFIFICPASAGTDAKKG